MRKQIPLAILLIFWSNQTFCQEISMASYVSRRPINIETQIQLDNRIKNLDVPIPENLSDLISENNKIESELTTLNSSFLYLTKDLEKMKKDAPDSPDLIQLKKIIAQSSLISCNNRSEFQNNLRSFLRYHSAIDGSVNGISPFSIDDSTNCTDFKSDISNVAVNSINKWAHDGEFSQEEIEKRRKLVEAYGKLVSGLQNRQASISNSLKQIQQRESLTTNFPWFIVLFGGLSLGAILALKLFSVELQMEWIASGQVTQFVTVMILMIVITMLGLSKTITGETLGTLLGSVAGYVLAQGVGRAAARDASRTS